MNTRTKLEIRKEGLQVAIGGELSNSPERAKLQAEYDEIAAELQKMRTGQ